MLLAPGEINHGFFRLTRTMQKKKCLPEILGKCTIPVFFMQNTIGDFARSKIMNIISTINKSEIVSEETLSNWKLLVSKIGDDLLKNLLSDKITTYEKNILK